MDVCYLCGAKAEQVLKKKKKKENPGDCWSIIKSISVGIMSS